MKRNPKHNNSLRLTLWYWFMEFVLLTFLLLWVCQVLFLQNFYDRMKTKDVMRAAEKIIALYQSGEYQEEDFTQLAFKNDLCFQILDRRYNWQISFCTNGNCFIHGFQSESRSFAKAAAEAENGVYTSTKEQPLTHAQIMI